MKRADHAGEFPCPHCGKAQDRALTAERGAHRAPPTNGDVIICLDCAGVGIMRDGALRQATNKELVQLTFSRPFCEARSAVRAVIEGRKQLARKS